MSRRTSGIAPSPREISFRHWECWEFWGYCLSPLSFLLREPPSRKKKESPPTTGPAKLIGIKAWSTASGGGVSDAGAGLVMEAAAGLSLTPPDVAPSNPVQTTVVVASGSGETESTGSGFRLPPPTVYALPEPKQTRNIISAVREKINITSLQRGMEIAFDAYGKVQSCR